MKLYVWLVAAAMIASLDLGKGTARTRYGEQDVEHSHPGIAARVGGHSISGTQLAIRERILRRLPKQLADSEIEDRAIVQLIREAALLRSAPEWGVNLTVDEVRVRVASMRALSETEAEAGESLAEAARHLGVTVDEFVNDSRVLETYRRAFTIEDMRRKIAETLPSAQQTSEGINTAIDSLVRNSGVRVEISIP